MSHLRAVDIVFGSRYTEYRSKQFERGIAFVVAETPEFESVHEGHLPWFLARDIYTFGYLYAVYQHPTANEWYIELFDVVPANLTVTIGGEFLQDIGKILQYGYFVVACQRFYS